MSIHACGQCNQQFDTPEAFANHVCPVTGVKITEPQSMGPNWQAIQQAALDRGAARAAPDSSGQTLKEADLIQVVKSVKSKK